MNLRGICRNWWKKSPKGVLAACVSIVGLLVSIVVAVIQFTHVLAVNPTATVECESWRMPSFMNNALTVSNVPPKYANPEGIAELSDANGMYHLFVENKSGQTIKTVRVAIPDAYYVEYRRYLKLPKFSRDSSEPYKASEETYSGSWILGDIDNGYIFEVNAWTKYKPSRDMGENLVINHETEKGCSVNPTIVGIWSFDYSLRATFVVLALVLVLLLAFEFKFCRRLCGL